MRGSRSKTLHDRAVINCQYSMATFSTAERKRRPHGDRKSSEMSLHLKQTFEAAVLTQLYPRSQIDIYVKVVINNNNNNNNNIAIISIMTFFTGCYSVVL